jgi:purine-cytosine permease-like protein
MSFMVVEEVGTVIVALGKIGLWIQALGIVVVLWIIFQLINFFINRRRMKEIYTIKDDMKRMENKLDKLLKKK